MAAASWKEEAEQARDILESSVPKQWLAPANKLPPANELNVEEFPRTSGLLSEEELRIAGMSATTLVAEMGLGKLSAENVVLAFLKRATLRHQLVCDVTLETEHIHADGSSAEFRN
jgi:amidase